MSLARLMITPDPLRKVPIVMDMLFPAAWLDSQAEDDTDGRTNRQVQIEVMSEVVQIFSLILIYFSRPFSGA